MLRWLRRALIAIAVLAALLVGGAYVYLRRSLPQMDGTIRVSGISGPVDIIRDADSVTHVFGATKADAYFGLGYAHAQDRLWQMEFQRRVGMARLSEVFGPPTVNTDRFLRTLGTGRAARSAWASLPAQTKQAIDAYVAGVNAFISTHHGSALPLEFIVLRFEPEPWTGPDVLAWVKMMAWDLSKNYTLEVLRQQLDETIGAEKTAELLPPYPANGLTILPRTVSQRSTTEEKRTRRTDPPFPLSSVVESFSASSVDLPSFGSALGSNNWVVDGTMTASGKPMLANDPHLDAQIPSLWYLAHLSAPGFDVIGATLPGAPAVVIGRNKYIAWGETNVMADVQDLYAVPPDEPLRTIRETIVVKGGAPIQLDVRLSRHGPIMSDAINANSGSSTPQARNRGLVQPAAFRWTALDEDDSTVTAMLKVNEARNWSEFTDALRDFVVPAQNFVYADVEGHIGYYAPGHFPIREHGEWTGWIPFDELPHAFDPPQHFIVSANNRITPGASAIEGEWIDPYRAQRITDRLTAKPKLTPDDFASIQADTYSLHAKEMLPILLQHARPLDARDAEAVAMLRQWNFDARGDSAATAIFQAWYQELPAAIVADKISGRLTADYLGLDRSSYRSRFLIAILSKKDDPWCDDVRTPARETCDDAVSKALHAASARLTKQLGGDMRAWRWDAVHHAVFAHSTFNGIPVIGRWLRREVPHGGDWSTVDVGPVFSPKPFEQHALPGYRQIVDLSPVNDSRFLDAVGQSGQVMSARYDDALPLWSAGQYRKMRMERVDAERDAIGRLRLSPPEK
jgi:penicillin G amidase